MEKLTRRKFFKSSALTLVAIPVLGKALGLFNKAYAEIVRDDSAIKLQGYVHDFGKADEKAYKTHMGKITDYLAEIKKTDAKVNAHCATCMQLKNEKEGYGECAMVLATGKADGKFVYKDGWCKVWTISHDKIKKEVGA